LLNAKIEDMSKAKFQGLLIFIACLVTFMLTGSTPEENVNHSEATDTIPRLDTDSMMIEVVKSARYYRESLVELQYLSEDAQATIDKLSRIGQELKTVSRLIDTAALTRIDAKPEVKRTKMNIQIKVKKY
jgi:hypothetical protein